MVLNPIHKIVVKHKDNIFNSLIDDDITIEPMSVTIENDINNLTQTAIIEIPIKNIKLPTNSNKYITYNNIEKLYFGDKIEISLGYNGILEQVFIGYLVDFEIKQTSIQLNLQDYMYFWKHQNKIQFSYDTITLIDLLKSMDFHLKLPDTWDDNNIIDFTLPKIRTTDYLTPAEVLKMLKDNYGFYAYYNKGKFYCGHKYPINDIDNNKTYVFEYPYFNFLETPIGQAIYTGTNQTKGYPIIKNGLSKQYVNDNYIFIVNVTQSDNSKQTYYICDDVDAVQTGDVPPIYDSYNKIVLNEVNLSDNEAKSICLMNYVNYPTITYKGDFDTFGIPNLYPTETLLLALNLVKKTNITIDDIDLNYFLVEKVTKTYNTKGYRQKITLDTNYLSKSKIYKN